MVNSPSIADTHSPSTAADTSLDNSGGTGGGITNDGTITNSGTVTVENSGSTLGIENLGTFTNGGTVDVENTGSAYGTGLDNAGTFTNDGTVTLENSGNTTGIYNSYFTFTNDGTVDIENTGYSSDGISSYEGTISNVGTVVVQTSSEYGLGIVNAYVTFTNDGTVDIENTGYSGYGIYSNETTINNIGFTYIANSGSESDGIYNDVAGTINNECSGTIDIAARNGGTGLYNLGTINNSGTITGTVSGNRIATSPACTIHALGTAVCINGVCGVTTGKAPASVYDTAYLIFSGGPPGQEAPTGSVFYTLYTGKTCEGTVLGTSFVTVKGGAGLGGYSTQEEVVPNSTTFAGLAPGSYSFEATYTSNNGYPSSSSTCTSAYLESFVVTPFYPIGVLSVLTPLIALAAFVMLSKRKSRQL